MTNIRHLQDTGYGVAVYELIAKAYNPQHEFFGNAQEILERYDLVDSTGDMPHFTRTLVQAFFADDETVQRFTTAPPGRDGPKLP
jgi:hypothetical protein